MSHPSSRRAIIFASNPIKGASFRPLLLGEKLVRMGEGEVLVLGLGLLGEASGRPEEKEAESDSLLLTVEREFGTW